MFKPYLESSFHVDLKNGIKLNLPVDMIEKLGDEIDVKFWYIVLKRRKKIYY